MTRPETEADGCRPDTEAESCRPRCEYCRQAPYIEDVCFSPENTNFVDMALVDIDPTVFVCAGCYGEFFRSYKGKRVWSGEFWTSEK